MTDSQRAADGRWHFSVGPVEKWVVGAMGAGILAGGYWLVGSVQTLVTQQAVTNAQLAALNQQLSDVPDLRRSVVELKVRVDKHEQEIGEIKQSRGAP